MQYHAGKRRVRRNRSSAGCRVCRLARDSACQHVSAVLLYFNRAIECCRVDSCSNPGLCLLLLPRQRATAPFYPAQPSSVRSTAVDPGFTHHLLHVNNARCMGHGIAWACPLRQSIETVAHAFPLSEPSFSGFSLSHGFLAHVKGLFPVSSPKLPSSRPRKCSTSSKQH